MSKVKRDKTIITSELTWIYANYNKFDSIMDAKQPQLCGSTIGTKIDHIKRTNYQLIYSKIIKEEQYTICLDDMSIICMYYIFDKGGTVVGHNLMYLPTPIDEDGESDFETNCAKYMRIDFDQTGYENIVHTKIHLHVGLYKTGLRIPIAHYISPRDFLYIVLKYIYHRNDEIIEKLPTMNNAFLSLSEDELNRLRIVFGKM